MDVQLLSDNIAKLRQRVRRSAEKSHFGNSDILVVAVSKTRSAEDVRAAHALGFANFGENYLREAVEKIVALQDLPLVWHFIGPIQSNKAGPIAEHFDWVQSIDREKIARRLNNLRPEHLPPLQVCLQINISGEASKSGANIDEIPVLARAILDLPRLELRGLMAIPAASSDETQQHESFSAMREALAQLKSLAPAVDTLSMGMSGDLEAAILEGANVIRVGTAIFGPRNR